MRVKQDFEQEQLTQAGASCKCSINVICYDYDDYTYQQQKHTKSCK